MAFLQVRYPLHVQNKANFMAYTHVALSKIPAHLAGPVTDTKQESNGSPSFFFRAFPEVAVFENPAAGLFHPS